MRSYVLAVTIPKPEGAVISDKILNQKYMTQSMNIYMYIYVKT